MESIWRKFTINVRNGDDGDEQMSTSAGLSTRPSPTTCAQFGTTPLQDPVVLARHVSLFQIGFISAIDQTFSLNDIAVG